MKGRKPKYSSELVSELAARIAAGESPSALAKEKGMSRSSVRRCAGSVRLPAEVKETNQELAAQVGTARQREKLFWRFVEAHLRQGISLAPKSAPREVASMLEAAVKLRGLMPSMRGAQRLPERQKAQETLLIFQRSLSRPVDAPVKVIEAEAVQGGERGVDRAASDSPADEGAVAEEKLSDEAKDATG